MIRVESGMRSLREAIAQAQAERLRSPASTSVEPSEAMQRFREAVLAAERRVAERRLEEIAPAALPALAIATPVEASRKECEPCTMATETNPSYSPQALIFLASSAL